MKCPKCGGEMEEGQFASIPINKGTFHLLYWFKHFGKALIFTTIKDETETKTYKCQNCGYLESYAK